MLTETDLPLVISFIAMIVSIIALIYTARLFFLKSGANIKGTHTLVSSSVSCEDKYISSLTLENLKDRAIVIFKIFLKLGHNYYVEIDNFEKEPLILKPFEVFKREYDPIDFYSINLKRININKIFDSKHVKREIVLSTSEGKYIVKSRMEHWDPVIDFFKNHMTAIIHPVRSTYKGNSYGINAKYIVDLKMENGKEEVVPIYPRDYEIQKFKKFRLTKEALESKEALEEFLYDQMGEGLLNFEDVQVHDVESWRNEVYKMESKKIIYASHYNWFMYNIVGPISTKISEYRLRKKNLEMSKQRTKKQI